MTETKFTPAPWKVVSFTGKNTEGFATDYTVVTTDQLLDVSTYKANANLIAAAPDLYNVLDELEESAYYWSEYDVPLGIQDRITKALAKARGES